MADIEALMKRCQIGVPRGPNAYDALHSILAECYGALGVLSASPQPDCRSCAKCFFGELGRSPRTSCIEVCTNGDRHQALPPVQLWRAA